MRTQKHSLWKKNNNNRTYELSFSGIKNQNTYSGTEIAIEIDLHPCFKRMTDRISTSSFQFSDKHEGHVIDAYASTHAQSQKELRIWEDFYNKLEKVTSKHAENKHLLLILGDVNAKTGSGQSYTLLTLANMAKVTLNQMVNISWSILKKTILYLPTHYSITSLIIESPGPP